MMPFTAITRILHTNVSPVMPNRLRIKLRTVTVFLQKCLPSSIDNLSLRSWRVFGADKVEDECIEPWHVPRANAIDPLIDILKIAQVIVTEPPLDTPQQSLGTRGDRSWVKLSIQIYKKLNKFLALA